MSKGDTPMVRQYKEIKAKNSDKILFFRVGDFYEMFFEDAKIAARELEITLTSRETGKDNHVPLAGFPYHAADNYIARFIEKGYKVAICEQVNDPKTTKGLLKREIVRIITPGTMVEEKILEAKENNYLASIAAFRQRWAVATLDLSTGEFLATEFEGEKAKENAFDEFCRLSPAECLVTEELKNDSFWSKNKDNFLINFYPDSFFDFSKSEKILQEHFSAFMREDMDLTALPGLVCAAGALLNYLQENHSNTSHVKKIIVYHPDDYMMVDDISRKNLELTATIQDGKRKGSLLWVVDRTLTAMGGRLLKKWLEQPLINKENIVYRQNIVEEIREDISLRSSLLQHIKEIYDLERLISRINLGTSNARDFIFLKNTLLLLPPLKKILNKSKKLSSLAENIIILNEITDLIARAIKDHPPVTIKEGGIIKEGFNPELDRLREISGNSKQWIAELEDKEKDRTGIKSLKIRYNRVFGYYIEVTNANLHMVPAEYMRKQTLANAERFITKELKEREAIILQAEESIKELEYNLFQEIRKKISRTTEAIQTSAATVAQVDCLLSLALVSLDNRYVKPEITLNDEIVITEGRHPVVEQVLTESLFVANDITLQAEDRFILLTGPNMAGKSTFLRQTALLVLMAQIGSFVPARQMKLGVVDRIFTRVGAADDLAGGRSTFMVEMNELANILKNATRRSLIILDEVGRGTSTYDGLSIAWAMTEFIHNRIKAKTIFASHYHELTALANTLSGIRNFNIVVKERGEEIVFLRKVVPGGADRSYGIQVARLAGLPVELIKRAKEILSTLEFNKIAWKNEVAAVQEGQSDIMFSVSKQMVMPERNQKIYSEIKERIEHLDLVSMSPLEVVQKVHELQLKIKHNELEEGNDDG